MNILNVHIKCTYYMKLISAVGRKCTWTASACSMCFTIRFHMADAPIGIPKYRWCIIIIYPVQDSFWATFYLLLSE